MSKRMRSAFGILAMAIISIACVVGILAGVVIFCFAYPWMWLVIFVILLLWGALSSIYSNLDEDGKVVVVDRYER